MIVVPPRKMRETWAEEGTWQADNPKFSGGLRYFLAGGLHYFLGGNYFWENASVGSVPLFLSLEIECRGSCHSGKGDKLEFFCSKEFLFRLG